MSAWAEETKTAEMPQINVTDKNLPFEHQLMLAKGKAAILTLPNGKDVAFWCEGGHLFLGNTGLTTDPRSGACRGTACPNASQRYARTSLFFPCWAKPGHKFHEQRG